MLTVIAGDWPAQSVLAFKQGFSGPIGFIISTGILKHEEISLPMLGAIEVVTDAASPLIAGDDQVRQLASLFFASREAKQGASLVLIQLRDARRMLVKANRSEVGQLMALLREMQKAEAKASSAPKTAQAPSANTTQQPTGADKFAVKAMIYVGVVFLPFLFVWALLGKGHPTFVRVLGFAWAGLLLLIIVTSMSGAPTSQEATTAPAPEAQQSQQQAAAPAPSTGPSDAARAAFAQTHEQFMNLAGNCDRAWDIMTEAIGTNDVYASYRAANRGADVCRDVSLAIGRLSFSSQIDSETRRGLNGALDDCSLAMVGRQTAMEQAARIFDGNVRPSAVEQFRSRAQFAQSQTISCMVDYLSAATSGGFEIPDPGN